MKIQQLSLAAYGAFTDKTLNLGNVGLHIVYGPNEAGKSTALRGLKGLLYGIESRTLDNFLHVNKDLRIGGVLIKADGQEITFVRRKGNSNTLLNQDGEALDDQLLVPYLQGVKPELFETLFGIDHDALVRGGKEILNQEGEVGQALFSAALGSPALHEILAKLDSEASDLFRPSASTKVINAALKNYSDLKRDIKEASLTSKEWIEKDSALSETKRLLQQIEEELGNKRSQANKLQRIKRVLPKLATRCGLIQEQEALGDVIVLADDFIDRHKKTVSEVESADLLLKNAKHRLDHLKGLIKQSVINQDLLKQAETIDDLHSVLGSHRKALLDRPDLDAERRQLLKQIESLLKDIRPDLTLKDIDVLRPIVARRQAIANQGSQKALLVSKVEEAGTQRRETETLIKQARLRLTEVQDLGNSDDLRAAIKSARKLGDIDTAIQNTSSDHGGLQATCDEKLSRLRLWEGKLEDLTALKLPSRETINHYETTYDTLNNRRHRLEEKKQQVIEASQDTTFQLDEIQQAGMVPTEEDLRGIREQRDQVWQLLRRQWINKEDVSEDASSIIITGKSLPEVFEGRVVDADELSDRLRHEADRVQKMATLQAKQNLENEQSKLNQDEFSALEADQSDFQIAWQDLWESCNVTPLSPREMLAWLTEVEKLLGEVDQLNTLQRSMTELETTRQTHIMALNQQLHGLGVETSKSKELDTVINEAEEIAQKLDDAKQARNALTQQVKGYEDNLELLIAKLQHEDEKLTIWETEWRELLNSLGLQENYTPAEMDDFTEAARELFEKQARAGELSNRIERIDDEAEAFSTQVKSLLEKVAPELGELSTEEAVLRLHTLVAENREKQTKREQNEESLNATKQEIQESTTKIATMNERLDGLCAEAKCVNQSDLEEAERRSTEYLRVKAAITAIEQELLRDGEGATISDLEREAEGVDVDELPAQIDTLIHSIDEMEPQRTALAETKGREQKELELMDGNDHAAVLADEAQSVLTGIRAKAERYVRVKLAGKILRDQVEEYRKTNQGPLIKRASEHFTALSLGSFAELMTDFNDKDEPVLVGIRPDGEKVYVEGMSSGTRDQLYLSLRLASLEKYMETAEPMPFIVDDVLVDFDDERSKAAISALSTMAESTQVIMFTHHSQVVDQAQSLPGPVHIHRL